MKYPIRILHVVYLLNRGGMESRIMDLYRNLNKERYQMDFYVESGEHGVFENEIKQLGGRIFYPLHRGKKGIPNFRSFRRFLENHSEYKVVYAYNQWSGFYLKQAFECGVPNRIAYARTSLQKKTAKNWIKNIVKLNVKKYINDIYNSGRILYMISFDINVNGTEFTDKIASKTEDYIITKSNKKIYYRDIKYIKESRKAF